MTAKAFMRRIRKQSIKKMILPLFILILCFLLRSYYPYRFVVKSEPIRSLSQLVAHSPDKKPFISISGKEFYYSGADFVAKGQLKGSYYYIMQEDTLLFFLLEPYDGTTDDQIRTDLQIKGIVVNQKDAWQTLLNQTADDLSWNTAELSRVTYPYLIDGRTEQYRISIIGFLAAILFLLLPVLALLQQFFYLLFPKRSPVYQILQGYLRNAPNAP